MERRKAKEEIDRQRKTEHRGRVNKEIKREIINER